MKDAGLDEDSVRVMKAAYQTSVENSRHAEYIKNAQGGSALHHLAAMSKDTLESTYMVPSHWSLSCVVEDWTPTADDGSSNASPSHTSADRDPHSPRPEVRF